MNITTLVKRIENKGRLVYEYNPLHNYRLENDSKEKYYHLVNGAYKELLSEPQGQTIIEYESVELAEDETSKPLYIRVIERAGKLKDFTSDKLNFDLNHPVDVLPTYTYDGTVNLILNDGKNYPKLINTRFTDLGDNKYEIIDRKGNADTNIYDNEFQFDTDTALYKKVNSIPKLTFLGTWYGGDLAVGNYHFYFKYTDGDGNDTDFVTESGLVSVFIGSTPKNIQSGIEDQNSNKLVKFYMSGIDTSYSYVKVYYTRASSAYSEVSITKAYEIDKKYIVSNGRCDITITGSETTIPIDIAEINQRREYYTTAKTLTVCQNRLFLGGLTKAPIEYKELADLSLRFVPKLYTPSLNSELNENYESKEIDVGYYSPFNIYNKVGYWPDEIYRLGIVYILNDGSLSPVFNIRGANNVSENMNYLNFNVYDSNEKRLYIGYDEETNLISKSETEQSNAEELENVKGVIKIKRLSEETNSNIYSIKICIQDFLNVMNFLKNTIKIQGFFFVRQRRIPTTLCLALTIGVDPLSNLPVPCYLKNSKKTYEIERFLDDSRNITNDFESRLYKLSADNIDKKGAFCPDYDVDYPFYNNFFTGENFVFYKEYTIELLRKERHYYESHKTYCDQVKYDGNIIGIQDSCNLVAVNKNKWSAKAGEAEEAYRFSYIGVENKSSSANNLVRGLYGPYLGLVPTQIIDSNYIVSIKIPGYDEGKINLYFEVRYDDESPFYAISDRFRLKDIKQDPSNGNCIATLFRGDCYICQFTHRINRNFQDPEAPNNDTILKASTWKENYDVEDIEKNSDINRGDVNAVQLGLWITFTVRSSRNLNIRALDISQVSESSLVGHPRTFYPHDDMNTGGSYKIPEALTYNDGFLKSVSDYWNILVPDVPYLQDKFTNRIAYSDISITNSFKNGFRIFKNGNYRDYNMEYGAITKIVEFFGNIICIFEHGIAKIPVNERSVAGSGSGGDVFINTSNVLPLNPLMLSNQIGSQWKDSIIKTQTYIYGVDTIAKKIWRTNGENVEIISNFSVQRFLNENITLGEREKTPIIGVRDVKSHYNAFKQDVMFTFYDNLNEFEEKAWNLCWSELLQKWITFYSWIPSDSENINNIWFTFNRDISKIFSQAQVCLKDSEYASGIVLDNVFWTNSDTSTTLSLIKNGKEVSDVIFTIGKDPFGNYNLFSNLENNNPTNILRFTGSNFNNEPYYYLKIIAKQDNLPEENYKVIIINKSLLESGDTKFSNYFWKHGQGGIIEAAGKILPCRWYAENHPFEFEFVVAENPLVLKIFENLQIISNNVAPESFHYEIVGDGYDFSDDKKNMFFRQEATKELYQYNGSDITFDDRYKQIIPSQRAIEGSNIKDKSTIFPLYYTRQDTINEIYDCYQEMTTNIEKCHYDRMSGSEIVYDELLNQFSILMHAKGVDITKAGRIRGNMHYKEDKWDIQINPIVFRQKNELDWTYPPLSVVNTPIPPEVKTNAELPPSFTGKYTDADKIIDWNEWTLRKETKPRDKFIKIKVRYYRGLKNEETGELNNLDLVVISALKTLYTISYA